MRPSPPDAVPSRPITFTVGRHTLVLRKIVERRWSVTVDDRLLGATYETQAEAWEAGVRDADRLDRAP